MSSNYPDNIRDYDNCPGSPFYEAPWPKCPQCGEQYNEENDGGFETDFLDSVDDEVFCCSEECRDKYNTENKEDIIDEPVDFEEWWANEGSGITPEWDHDMEEHAKVVAKAAWEFRKQQEAPE